jgi:hypothetical protein
MIKGEKEEREGGREGGKEMGGEGSKGKGRRGEGRKERRERGRNFLIYFQVKIDPSLVEAICECYSHI